MKSAYSRFFILLFAAVAVSPNIAQVSPIGPAPHWPIGPFPLNPTAAVSGGTSSPSDQSFAGWPDVINQGNLNAHWVIPIRHKAGRGTDFTYDLTYDSAVWTPVTSGSTKAWQPAANWGWQGLSTAGVVYAGYSMATSAGACGQFGQGHWQSWTYSNVVYYDEHGLHTFNANGSYIVSPGGTGCPSPGAQPPIPITTPALDNSGIVLTWSVNQGSMSLQFSDRGTAINPPIYVNGAPSGTPTYNSTDMNGNTITMSNGIWTDTLGQTALTVMGSAPSNTTLSFANNSGNSTATVIYTPYNIMTYFNCSGITEYSALNIYLADTIQLPNGTQYRISYEQTPQHSGYYTGRPLSVSLPTGGTITYAYSGGSNGIECADGTIAGLTRTTPDGTWTYSRSGSGSSWTTTVLAPMYPSSGGTQDQTSIDFLTGGSGLTVYFYPIRERRYSGTSTLLETNLVCYEASDANCSATTGDSGASVTLPFGRLKKTRQLWGTGGAVISSGALNQIDSYGNISSHAVYDFASGTSFGSLLETTSVAYNTYYNQFELPAGITVTDAATPANTIASTIYQYTSAVTGTSGTPSHVNQTAFNISAIKQWVSGSTYLTSNYDYFDTGNVKTATDVNGTSVTTYTYGACGNSFVTATSTPVKSPSGTVTATLASSGGWNCAGGVPTTNTDLNGNIRTLSYGSDPYWRPISISDSGLNSAILTYANSSSPNTWSSSMSFNAGGSQSNSVTTTDALGRAFIQQRKQGPSTAQFDSVALSYDSRGRLSCRTAVPYPGTQGFYAAPSSSTGKCITYDTLDRASGVTDAGSGSVAYTYGINTSLLKSSEYVSAGPPPVGENAKRRLLSYNGAGQVASVCEVTSLAGSGSCGSGTGYNGYLTQYTYDGPDLTKTQQSVQPGGLGAQTRTINGFDGLGRILSETIPEWSSGSGVAGTTNYTYDSDSACGSTSSGDIVKTIDNVGNVICNKYDSLHRILTSTVSSGSYALSTPAANYVYDAANCNGAAMQNAAGNLAEAYTGSIGSKITDLCFSNAWSTSGATTGGVVSKVWELTPHSAGYFLTTDTYFQNDVLGVRTTSYGSPTINYGLDGEGRQNTATDTTHTLNLVTGTSYNTASIPTGITYGNGDSDSFGYDASTLRPTSILNTITGSSPFTFNTSLTWNSNWALKQMQITDTSDSSKNQTCTYTADDMRRLASVNCGSSTWAQNFTYDAFGNIAKANAGNATSYTAAYSAITNQVSSGISPLPGYDNNGNQLNSTGLLSISWNAAAVPVSVTPLNGSTITGTFDALNRLVETASGSTYTQFVYGSDSMKVAVMRGGSLLKGVAALPGGETAVYNSSGLSFIRHTDWLGSSRLATTWAHGVYSKESYAPFGEVYNELGTADRSFTGQDQDTVSGSSATGIYDFMFRKDDPAAGRWLSPDPLGWGAVDLNNPQSLDRYAYVENNPLSWVDPLGLCQEVVTAWAPNNVEAPWQGTHPTEWSYRSGGSYGPPCDSTANPGQPASGNPQNGNPGGGGGDSSNPPPTQVDCVAAAKGAAIEAVKSNFNLDFAGVSATTAAGMAYRGKGVLTVAKSLGEGIVYTGIWTGLSAAVQGSMTGFVCSVSQISAGLNYIASSSGRHH